MKKVASNRFVVAVSGGVDSMALLDMMAKHRPDHLVVAHFDHGIRASSSADARFVEASAKRYGASFIGTREELGSAASEDFARQRRYSFLRQVAAEEDALIVTAHHADDIVETVAINIQRGTGWRGVAVLDSKGLVRPLLGYTKDELREYALMHALEWVEDETNATDAYLRNRLRRTLNEGLSADNRQKVCELRDRQVTLKREIQEEAEAITGAGDSYDRHVFIMSKPEVASELLQAVLFRHVGVGATRPQREKAVLAIKTAQPGTIHQVGGGSQLRFTKRQFIVETVK